MLDVAEIQRRLGEGIAGVPDAEESAPTVGMDVVRIPPTAAAPESGEPVKAVEAEASTRFVQAMQGVGAPFRPDGTTERPAPGAGSGRPLQPRRSTPPPELPVTADPEDAPASWPLLGLTAAVWAGVLVLGVYATLLVVSR